MRSINTVRSKPLGLSCSFGSKGCDCTLPLRSGLAFRLFNEGYYRLGKNELVVVTTWAMNVAMGQLFFRGIANVGNAATEMQSFTR